MIHRIHAAMADPELRRLIGVVEVDEISSAARTRTGLAASFVASERRTRGS
jgi:hypothetical protein